MAIGRSGVAKQLQTLLNGGAVTGMTDSQLLERFATGRAGAAEPAFTALVKRHGPMVLSVCRGFLKNQHDADDAFQATFLVLARKAGTLRQTELLGPWLYGVAYRSARRLKEKDQRRRRYEAEAAMSRSKSMDEGSRPEPISLDREEIGGLLEEIESLPEKYRSAIVLCELEGLTHAEAALRLGHPVSTISARIRRARERLRGRLGRRGLVLPAGSLALAIGSGRASAMPPVLAATTIKAAISLSTNATAATIPASVTSLAEGVIKNMFLTKLKIASAALAMTGAAAGGVGVLAQRGVQTPAAEAPATRAAVSEPSTIRPASAPPEQPGASARNAENQADGEPPSNAELITRCVSRMRRVSSALQIYVEKNKLFPQQALYGADQKPLLSWRVAILPYLGDKEKALYDQFNLDEPWDGPHNKALLAKMPSVYAPVVKTEAMPGQTYIQSFVGKGAFFEDDKKIGFAQFTDGLSNTFMLVDGGTPVSWTKPEDIPFVPGQPLPKLGGQFKDGFVSITADGAPRFSQKSIDPILLQKIVTRNGGEVVGFPFPAGEILRNF